MIPGSHTPAKKVLVTGGAGFIGSHLVDALLLAGYDVCILDNLEPQVHGNLRERGEKPVYLNPDAEFILGDVRNQVDINRALQGVEVVFHLAAATGVGQSMYQIAHYFEVNVQGTANILNIMANQPHSVTKLVLASSRAIYGEGAYQCAKCGIVHPPVRSPAQLDAHDWEPACPACSGRISPIPTPESLPPNPGSMYAITKLAQEQMCLTFGQAYNLPVAALRFFNVYGPRQSLNNPYTGIITVFLTRLLNGQAPDVYEDGQMTRDFVYVSDVVQACMLAIKKSGLNGVFNIGSGVSTTILDTAKLLSRLMNASTSNRISGRARVGDVRHCTADMRHARNALEFTLKFSLHEGLLKVLQEVQTISKNESDLIATQELKKAGLLR